MKNSKLLLVEDDKNLGTILKEFLILKNYEVTHAVDGKEGYEKFLKDNFHLCIVDVMMPLIDGFSLAQKIRDLNPEVPIIFLTAKSMLQDKLTGLRIGADDYITKPFDTEELLLRINAVLKRSNKSYKLEKNEKNFIIGKYKFNSESRILSDSVNKQKLTSKEAELLKLLCMNIGNTLERTTALNLVWKEDNYFNSRSMDVYIAKLRNYLKKDASVEIINIHGIGFKLVKNDN